MIGRRRRTAGRAALGVAVAVALVHVGCGYRLAGTGGGVLPPTVRTIVVTAFENRTTRPEIEQRVTEEVTRELSRRGGYRVATNPADADAELRGVVATYRTSPVQFSASGRATRVEAVVTLSVTVRDLRSDAVLWSQDGLLFREQFDVPETGAFFDQETVALDDIARGAASVLVTSILEGF